MLSRSLVKAWTVTTVLLSLVSATAVADDPSWWTNDAGTGHDAGNSASRALDLGAFGTYSTAFNPGDVDWFSVTSALTGPQCVQAKLSGEAAADASLYVTDASGAIASAIGHYGDTGAITMGLATTGVTQTYLNHSESSPITSPTKGFSHNTIALTRGVIPATPDNDANLGVDAPASATNAPTVGGGCIGGRLGAVGNSLDVADYYSMGNVGGKTMTFSFASTAPGISLNIVDAAGNTIASLAPGQELTLSLSSTSYTLSATRTSVGGVGDIGYLIGVAETPPGCQPAC